MHAFKFRIQTSKSVILNNLVPVLVSSGQRFGNLTLYFRWNDPLKRFFNNTTCQNFSHRNLTSEESVHIYELLAHFAAMITEIKV